MRLMRSIKAHNLPISRAIFRQDRPSYGFMPALNMSLFLSANGSDVRDAVAAGLPAGHVLKTARIDDETEPELRIAFDFDGVVASDSAERVYRDGGIESFRAHEVSHVATPTIRGRCGASSRASTASSGEKTSSTAGTRCTSLVSEFPW